MCPTGYMVCIVLSDLGYSVSDWIQWADHLGWAMYHYIVIYWIFSWPRERVRRRGKYNHNSILVYQSGMLSNIIWMILSDRLDTDWVFIMCIHYVYPLVCLTTHPILSGWCCWTSRIPIEYSLGVSIGQPDSASNIIWVILLDQPNTQWIFIVCIYWSAWQSIQYCLDDTGRSAGYPLNIHWVYPLVSLTVHPILSGWYCQISRMPTEYSLGVSIGQPDSSSNIVWVLSDQLNTQWIFIVCIYWSAWQSIQYCLDDTVRSAGYPLNIHYVYPLVSLIVHPILGG